eukprot:757658-Hanusia_phi.AAC.3
MIGGVVGGARSMRSGLLCWSRRLQSWHGPTPSAVCPSILDVHHGIAPALQVCKFSAPQVAPTSLACCSARTNTLTTRGIFRLLPPPDNLSSSSPPPCRYLFLLFFILIVLQVSLPLAPQPCPCSLLGPILMFGIFPLTPFLQGSATAPLS